MTTQSKTVNEVQAESLTFALNEVWEAIKRNQTLLKLAFVLTFLLYLLFNQHLYLGDATGWGEYLKDTSSMLGFSFMVIVTVLMALFLAGVKHHLYIHFGAFGQVFYVVALMIGFALLAEAFSTSASQDVKSRIMLSNDDAYQQTLSAPAPVVSNSTLTKDIAKAQQVYQRCVVNRSLGKEKHCQGDRAALESLKQAKQDEMAVQKHVGVETQKLNYSRQDQLKADSYNPIVVSVAKMVAGSDDYKASIKTAIMILMMIVAIVFEVLHHVLSRVNGELRERKTEIEMQLATLHDRMVYERQIRDEYQQATTAKASEETVAQPTKKRGWGVTPVVGAGVGVGSDGLGLGLGAGAMFSPKAVAEPAAKPLEKAPSLATETAPITQSKAPLEQPKEQPKEDKNKPTDEKEAIAIEAEKAPETEKSRIGFTADVSPAQPANVPKKKDSDTSSRSNIQSISLANAHAKHADQNTQTGQPKHAQIGSLNTQDFEQSNTQENVRVLRARTQKHAETRTAKHAENTQPNTQDSDAKHADSNELFTAFIAALKAKKIKPTVSESRKFVQQKIAASQQTAETPTLVQCGKIANLLIRKATIKKVLIKNPKKGNNQPNHILNGDAT